MSTADDRRGWNAAIAASFLIAIGLCCATALAQHAGVAERWIDLLLFLDLVATVVVLVIVYRDVQRRLHAVLAAHPDLDKAYRNAVRHCWLGAALFLSGCASMAAGVELTRDESAFGSPLCFLGSILLLAGAMLVLNLRFVQQVVWTQDLSDRTGFDFPRLPLQTVRARDAVLPSIAITFGIPALIFVSTEAATLSPGQIVLILLGLIAVATIGLATHAWWARHKLAARDLHFRPRRATPAMWIADGLIVAGLVWAAMGARVVSFDHWQGLLAVFGGAALPILLAWWLLGRDR